MGLNWNEIGNLCEIEIVNGAIKKLAKVAVYMLITLKDKVILQWDGQLVMGQLITFFYNLFLFISK